MTTSKTKIRIAWVVATVAVTAITATALAQPPSGYLLVDAHHAGVMGDNDIAVTATELEGGISYAIKMEVSYHENPRTPPCEGDTRPDGYFEWFYFLSDGSPVTHMFTARLPDCHWQITAGFTLLYWDGQHYSWNGDPRATETVDIWSDCPGPPAPAYLTLIKTVINDDGGTLTAANFPAYIDSTAVTWGVAQELAACPYTASETEQPGYTASAWSGDCNPDGTITLAPGDNKTCSITNNDIPPAPAYLTLIKTVINDDGGTLTAANFPAYIDSTAVTWGVAQELAAGTYTASETEQPGYTASAWSGDCNPDGTITLAPGDNKTCSITNNDIPPTPVYEIYLPITMKNY